MTKRHLLQMAKQGDVKAIATLINRTLQPKGITATVTLKQGYLQIWLDSEKVSKQTIFVNFVRQGLARLEIENLRLVRIYGRKKGQKSPSWQEGFRLSEQTPSLEQFNPNPIIIKELAQEGDLDAISVLLNRVLAHKQITTTVNLAHSYLHIILHADQVPSQNVAVTLIDRELVKLQTHFFKVVDLAAQKNGDELFSWRTEFEVGTAAKNVFSGSLEQPIQRNSLVSSTKPLVSNQEAKSKFFLIILIILIPVILLIALMIFR